MVYIFVFFVSVFLLSISEKEKNVYKRSIAVSLAILIPSVLAGIRDYTIGKDVLVYGNSWFERAVYMDSFSVYIQAINRNSMGVGYGVLNYVVSRFTDNAHWFYFTLMLLELSILYISIKPYKENISISFAFFCYYFYFYNDSLNALRQIPAILIVLFSFRFVEKKRLVLFVLCIGVAASFHVTALIGVLIYPISLLVNSKLRKIFIIAVFGIMISVVLLFSKITQLLMTFGVVDANRFNYYFSSDGVTGGRVIRIAVYLTIFILFLAYKNKICKNTPYGNALFMYSSFSFILSSLLLLYSNSYIIRIAYYFDIFLVMYVPLIAKSLNIRTTHSRVRIRYFIVGACFICYWIIVYVIRKGAGTVPYVLMQS